MFFIPIYCTFSDSYCNIPAYKVYRYSSRINEVYVFFINKISLYRYFIEKNLNFIYRILWNIVTVCFAAIELVIVLAWFL